MIQNDIHTQRNEILKKVKSGAKISKEERFFLETTPAYNSVLGYPYLLKDVVNINSSDEVSLSVVVESISYDEKIIPVISVPAQKGMISTSFELFNYKGELSKDNKTKVLGVDLSDEHKSTVVQYKSDLSLLAVNYECWCYNMILKKTLPESSMCGKTNYAMSKEVVSENKIRYFCKSPDSDSFDAMVFYVEWN